MGDLQKYNYHTHTVRCGHASGTDQEYVDYAIKEGFERLGFSEHMGFKGWDDPGERVDFLKMEDYEEAIFDLRARNSDIQLLVGYEAEYFSDLRSYYEDVLARVDYLTLGQHALDRKGGYLHFSATDYEVRQMADLVCEGLETGLFSYLAHPDYFMQARDSYSADCDQAMRQMAQVCLDMNIPLELNINGYIRRRGLVDGVEQAYYPLRAGFKTVAEVGAPVVIGYDSHTPEFMGERQAERELRAMAQELGLNLIEDYKIEQKTD